ncbi:MAG: DNA repair protein RecN [Actinobacteria bacterium]|uniref:DNA repair protein RecN n=1 Tax=freshwater metagenome TaxID=449393 RepID=A0A6J7CXH4_9ZZZZ|nr:DNA repair protein RecN [Actinomycetota bacterium]MSY11696.1 DNA repair protein RecN [Actinomycetota bacterium]MSZ04456.1 DNA repair protein RecN [Actinomycetota bacterium]MTB07685.1 DNA repair protein RecN [Actinomycetota bacterium]
MLTELHIENLGVIERLDLVLGTGFTVLTGETGAGKTMLVGAIELLLGGRADSAFVRPGADEARVEGRFVIGDDEVVLARTIPHDGRSRAYVDGRLATVSVLQEHGQRLVDLYGQHAHQSLLSVAAQRAALDRFAGTDLVTLRKTRARLTEIDASLAALGGDARARAREVDLLRFQRDEIDAASVSDQDEEHQLEQLEDLLSSAQSHREAAYRALVALDDDSGALDSLGAAVSALGTRSPFAPSVERLRNAIADLRDVTADLRSQAENIDDDPERLSQVRERRQLLRELRRKYGESLADVVAYRDEVASRLEELEGFEAMAARLESERGRAALAERDAAAAVAKTRRDGAHPLGEAIAARVQALAMPRARVEIVVGAQDPGDDVMFMLGANPGEPALPLSKVASGGELARTMLALRLVLTEAPDTLVFDEVDAGIGGSAASAVGEALADLGRRHQVLAVTHLAQVAALADRQVVVSKCVLGGRTVASAVVVDGAARVEEIARMLSGGAGSTAAKRHASELLQSRRVEH